MISAVNDFVSKLVAKKIPLSLTITGQSLESRRMENVNDIDIILVFSGYDKYKSMLDIAYDVQKNFSKKDVEICIVPQYGPVRPQLESGKWKMQFQIMVYTPRRLKRISPVSCLARYSWQFEPPYSGAPFKKYFSLDKISFDNVINSHWGILHCIDCIKNDRREYWEWISDKNQKFGFRLAHIYENLTSQELLLQFYVYCVENCARNYIRAKTGKHFTDKEKAFEEFKKEFSDKSFAAYPIEMYKEKLLFRQDKLKITKRLVNERKSKTLDFLESLKKIVLSMGSSEPGF